MERRWRSNRKPSLKQDEGSYFAGSKCSVKSHAQSPVLIGVLILAAAMTQMKKGSILKKFENFVYVVLLVILAARCLHRDSHETDETKSDGIVQKMRIIGVCTRWNEFCSTVSFTTGELLGAL
jgi:hypothetical protein